MSSFIPGKTGPAVDDAAPAADHTTASSMGDSPGARTPGPDESKSHRVMQVGDSFPWEYRDTYLDEEGKDQDRVTMAVATIGAISRHLVWVDLTLPDGADDPVIVAIGWPRRVHVMNADAAKALGVPLPADE